MTKIHNVQTFLCEVDPANWRASFGEAVASHKSLMKRKNVQTPLLHTSTRSHWRAWPTSARLGGVRALSSGADLHRRHPGWLEGSLGVFLAAPLSAQLVRFTGEAPEVLIDFPTAPWRQGRVVTRARAACQIYTEDTYSLSKKNFDQEMMICMRSSQRYERKMIRKQSDVRIKIVVLVH